MNGNDILNGMEHIDPKLIESAEKIKPHQSRKPWRFAAAAALFLCLAVAGAMLLNQDKPEPKPTETSSAAPSSDGIFINTALPLKFGFVSCYTNPRHEENPESEDNLYGVMDSDGNVVIEPSYSNAVPLSKDSFAVSSNENGKTYSSMIDKSGKTIIPWFEGAVWGVDEDGGKPIAIVAPEYGKTYIVDMSGKRLLDIDFDNVLMPITTRRHILEAYNTERAYYISYGGEIIAEFPANKVVLDPFGECKGSTVIACMYKVPEAGKSSILYGLYDSSSGRELVPCSRKEGYPINEERFVLKDTCLIGPEYDDFAAIYDKSGNVICGGGKYQDIDFTYGSSYGIGFAISPTETYYNVINTDGKAVGGKYDSIDKDADGNFVCKKGDQTETIKSAK